MPAKQRFGMEPDSKPDGGQTTEEWLCLYQQPHTRTSEMLESHHVRTTSYSLGVIEACVAEQQNSRAANFG